MRHFKKRGKLNRTSAHRYAMFKNLASSLIAYDKVCTTTAKAKNLKPIVEKLITTSRKTTLSSVRLVNKFIRDRVLLKKFFFKIVPRYKNVNGGYLKIQKYGFRKGDSSPLSILTFK